MKNENQPFLSPAFKRAVIPFLIVLCWLTFFFLDQYRLEVRQIKTKTSGKEIAGWMALQKLLVDDREEIVVESPSKPKKLEYQYPERYPDFPEPNDEGIEYDLLP